MNEEIKEELNAKFLCPQKFAQEIEDIVKNTQVNYIDAIVTYCEVQNIELDTMAIAQQVIYMFFQLPFGLCN